MADETLELKASYWFLVGKKGYIAPQVKTFMFSREYGDSSISYRGYMGIIFPSSLLIASNDYNLSIHLLGGASWAKVPDSTICAASNSPSLLYLGLRVYCLKFRG